MMNSSELSDCCAQARKLVATGWSSKKATQSRGSSQARGPVIRVLVVVSNIKHKLEGKEIKTK